MTHYDVLGYRFALRSELPGLTARVAELLRGFVSTTGGAATRYEARRESAGAHSFGLFRDGDLVQPATSEASILDFLLWDVNANALRTTPFLALHAAAASWRGRGVVMPAKMNAGKTTLVAGLVTNGFAYLSDEAALIDPVTGLLHPYAKPLWMEPPTMKLFSFDEATSDDASALRNYHVRPERLRPDCIGAPCEVGHVVAPQYVPGAETSLEPMTQAEMLMLLADNCFNLVRAGGSGMRVLADVLANTSCHRLTAGDLSSAVDAIRRLVTDGSEPHGSPWSSTSVSVA